METMGHDSQSETVEPDEVIITDNVLPFPHDPELVRAWSVIEEDNPPLYTILMQMASNIQEVVDFCRDANAEIEQFKSAMGDGGMLSMVMRMFKS